MNELVNEVEYRGTTISVDMGVFDDMDVLDLLDDFQSGDLLKFKKVLKAILGDSFDQVYELLRGEDGKVKASDASDFLQEIFDQTQAKN